MNYKGFQLKKTYDSYIIWGASHFDPCNVIYGFDSNLAKCKRIIDNLLESWNIKNWKTYE